MNQETLTKTLNFIAWTIIISMLIYVGYNFFSKKDSGLKDRAIEEMVSMPKEYTVDQSYENKVLVCRDATCTNPTPYILEFNKHRGQPFTIGENGTITGEIWGNELGWVSMNAPYNGVFLDKETGVLSGRAWSEISGVINFSVTGQQVKIDKNTGELSGWAWAGGPRGGWVKFDCTQGSCLHTTWRGDVVAQVPVVINEEEILETGTEKEKPFSFSVQNTLNVLKEVFLGMVESFKNLWENSKELFNNTGYSFTKSFRNTWSILFQISQEKLNISLQLYDNSFTKISSISKELKEQAIRLDLMFYKDIKTAQIIFFDLSDKSVALVTDNYTKFKVVLYELRDTALGQVLQAF